MNAWAFLAYIDRQQNYITQCRFLKKPTAHRQQWRSWNDLHTI